MIPKIIFAALLAISVRADAQPARAHPGQGLFIATANVDQLRQLFAHPDQWTQTRAHLSGIILSQTDWRISDDDLRNWFAEMKRLGLALELEVPSIKDKDHTGAEVFRQQQQEWLRLQRLGADISAIGMDEPFAAMSVLKVPMTYAIEQTTDYVRRVREAFPGVRIGDIEPYPFFDLRQHEAWINGLQAALRRSGTRGLDFYRADVDWNAIDLGARGSWPDVGSLKKAVHHFGLEFSLIYFAADYGEAEKRQIADDQTWFTETMHEGYAFRDAGGSPDQFVVESWINAPSEALPEEKPFTFTYSILQFARRFMR